MRALAKFAALLLVVMAIGTAGASPPALTTDDQAALRAVINAQIDALRREDYVAAYAVSSPAMKALYPTLQAYASVIRGRYAQLIRPKSIVFGTVTQTPQGPVQRVFLTGNDGRAYVVNYSLQKQPDNTWLIAGHTITRDNGSQAL